jgi:hypothetical protein
MEVRVGLIIMSGQAFGETVAEAFLADVVCLVLVPARPKHGEDRSGDA